MLNLYRLRRIVEEEGAAMVIAHPWRYNKDLGPRWDEVPDLFDAVEVYNGSDSNDANAYVARMVAERGLVGVGGSDAHSPGPVGSCATRLHDPIRDEADLIRALKGGSLEPVHLRRHHLRSKQFHRR
jgi:predicted metal-dependent phosphoesterase TrpH